MGVVKVYGIRNCETVKKARAWLATRGATCEFHDYKTAGVERARLEAWCRAHPSLIKRPVLDIGTRRVVGFSAQLYQSIAWE